MAANCGHFAPSSQVAAGRAAALPLESPYGIAMVAVMLPVPVRILYRNLLEVLLAARMGEFVNERQFDVVFTTDASHI